MAMVKRNFQIQFKKFISGLLVFMADAMADLVFMAGAVGPAPGKTLFQQAEDSSRSPPGDLVECSSQRIVHRDAK